MLYDFSFLYGYSCHMKSWNLFRFLLNRILSTQNKNNNANITCLRKLKHAILKINRNRKIFVGTCATVRKTLSNNWAYYIALEQAPVLNGIVVFNNISLRYKNHFLICGTSSRVIWFLMYLCYKLPFSLIFQSNSPLIFLLNSRVHFIFLLLS